MSAANSALFSLFPSSNLRRVVPFGRRKKPEPCSDVETHLAEALERLALTSPHLLADMGFEIDAAAGSPTRTVWRRGRLTVTLDRGLSPVAVRVGKTGA